MAPTDEADANPYTAPQANCVQDEDLALVLRRVVMIFRRMGWGGVLLFGTVSTANFAMNLSFTNPDFLVPMIILGVYTFFFWSMLRTATTLEKDFDSAYRFARWTAIIAGAFFFPFLTLPCYFAIRYMEEYRRRYPVENQIGDSHLNSGDRA
ncbi:MAG: hypothetical protein JWP89_2926 [Schlesneria sp.]|nr:hypothetical protein [Schlesneria sp.]